MIHHSFVVRICANPQGHWRGTVLHTGTQQSSAFGQFDTLVEFMRAQMSAMLLASAEFASDAPEQPVPLPVRAELNRNLTVK